MISMDFLVCREEISSMEEDFLALSPEMIHQDYLKKQKKLTSHFDNMR